MDLCKTIDFIINDLRETRLIIDDLKNYPDVPLFQIELAKSKCKSAEDLITLLKDFKEINSSESIPSDANQETAKVIERIEEPVETNIIEDNSRQIVESLQPSASKKSGKAILSDRFRENTRSINEKIGNSQGKDDINSMLKGKPITSLADAIGINDKFYYIREIFSGNHTSYNEAIKKLNFVDNFDDGRAVIMSYTGNNEENEAVLQLLELVKRKISFNE
jgi:hypothetical protein